MHLGVVQRILGLLLMLFSATMLPPIVVAWFFQDGEASAFLYAFGFTIFAGILIWLPVRLQLEELRLRDGSAAWVSSY
jgi:trk system potassium uptake protein TrkH